jgi:hypothetical protein
MKKRIIVVDDFYDDPTSIRNLILGEEFYEDSNYHKGKRTVKQYDFPGLREKFESIVGFPITRWTETYGACSKFQYCTAEDKLVYHCDFQTWAGVLYLTPDAPYSSGTSLFAHRATGLRNANDFNGQDVFGDIGFYDKSKFDLVDKIGNVFNRLIIFDARSIHGASEYFGTDMNNGRLFQVFFFD